MQSCVCVVEIFLGKEDIICSHIKRKRIGCKEFITTMSPSTAACVNTINGVAISMHPELQGQDSFLGGEPPLKETGEYFVALGISEFLSIFDTIFSKKAKVNSEQFT